MVQVSPLIGPCFSIDLSLAESVRATESAADNEGNWHREREADPDSTHIMLARSSLPITSFLYSFGYFTLSAAPVRGCLRRGVFACQSRSVFVAVCDGSLLSSAEGGEQQSSHQLPTCLSGASLSSEILPKRIFTTLHLQSPKIRFL